MRYNIDMPLKPDNLILVVQDITDMLFIINRRMEQDDTSAEATKYGMAILIIIGRIIDNELEDISKETAITFVKDNFSELLHFVGGTNFKEIYEFDLEEFKEWSDDFFNLA